MADKKGFITRYRQEVGRLLQAIDAELEILDTQYQALDYENVLTDDDFTPPNDDLAAQEFKDAVTSVGVLRIAFHNGTHDTRLYRLRREHW